MGLDKDALGCFAVLMVGGIVVLAAILIASNLGGFMDNANRSEAQRLLAQADLTRAQAQVDQVHTEHTETMFMLWSAALAAFTAGPSLINLLGIVVIGALAMAAGFAFGMRRP